MGVKEFLVHARLIVEPFKIGLTDELDEVLIASQTGRKQDQVIVVVVRQAALP
jgi:hypothetical protein